MDLVGHFFTMHVDRCVCFNITFERLRDYVEANGGESAVDFSALQGRFQCGRGCGLCVPYIQKMLHTGETRFPLEPPTSQSLP